MAEGLGDITLNGKKYRIDFPTWREKDIIDFAPRATVPGGSVVMSDLNLYQPLVQTDWRHGQGFHWYEDAAGYLATVGNVDTRQDGLAMLMTKATSSDTNNNAKSGMVPFNGAVYSYGAGGVRKYSGGAWSGVGTRYVSRGSSYFSSGGAATLGCIVSNIVVKNAPNRLLVVVVHLESNVSISDITFAGASLGAGLVAVSGTAPKTVIYKLVAPAVGTNSVVLTLGSASANVVDVWVLYNVDQSTPLGTPVSNSVASAASASIAYTSSPNRVIIDAITINAAVTPVPAAADTSLNAMTKGTSGMGFGWAAGAASVTTGWTWTGNHKAEQIAVEVNYIGTEPTCNFLLPAGDYMFICPNGDRLQKMDKNGTVTDAGLDHDAIDFLWLIIHNGKIFGAIDGTNQVHYDTNSDLSQMEGTVADPEVIYCGIGNIPTIRAIVYAAALYVARQDGLWTIGDDFVARRVIDYSNDQSANNFRGMAILNGYLIFALRDRVIQWNGARVSDITPNKVTDIFPYVMYGRYANFAVADNFLYCTGRTNETTYSEDLLCYDGVGWHKLMPVLADGTSSMTMIAFDVVNTRLWFHVLTTTPANTTSYVPLQAQSTFPYADFPTTGTHSLISSRLDMGFRRVKKSLASIIVEARNCSSTCYLSVYYQIDGDGTWIKWQDIKQSGIQEFTAPGGFLTREFNYINIRIDFTTGSATASPVLEGFTLRFIMRPNTLLGFNFWIIAASQYQHGVSQDERYASEIRDELLVVRNSKAPVELIGIEGDHHWGYLTSFQGQPVYRVEKEDEIPDEIEWRFQCNFVEVMEIDG